MSSEQAALAAVFVLADDSRAAMFAYVRRAGRPVTRAEAAAHAGISAKLAAFHLDKLVEAGLLSARPAPSGPLRRVGRAPKVYEPCDAGIQVNIPARRLEVLAEILAEAVAAQDERTGARDAAFAVAARRGQEMGSAQRLAQRPGRLGVERALTLACERLDAFGFEPERLGPTLVRLRNCPFHPVAAAQPELVCGINQAFLAGYLHGLEAPPDATAVLTPAPGACCVTLCAVRDLPLDQASAEGAAVACDAASAHPMPLADAAERG